MTSAILGIDCYLPDEVQTNDDLGRENPSWQMGRFAEKCGVLARHVARADETATDLAYEAARRLIDRRLVPTEEIDFLLFCTQSPDYFLPSSACILQDRLGLGRHVGALDFNLGCSGYVYGLHIAKQFVKTRAARNVLLVTADTYTKFIHPRDRSVRPLFGDGAAATLIGASDDGRSIGDFVLGTDGSGAENLIVPSGGLRLPRSAETAREFDDGTGCTRSKDHLFMDGMALMNFAVTVVPEAVRELFAKTRLDVDAIDWFVFHQANKFMLQNLARLCHVPWEKVVFSMENTGNTVSASIPIAMADYMNQGRICSGQRLALVGFGVGYSWGACVIQT